MFHESCYFSLKFNLRTQSASRQHVYQEMKMGIAIKTASQQEIERESRPCGEAFAIISTKQQIKTLLPD